MIEPKNDVTMAVAMTLAEPDDELTGRRVRFCMGQVGAAPRTVVARVVGRQRIWDGSVTYRVVVVDDPMIPGIADGTTPDEVGRPLPDVFEWMDE